MATKRFFTGFSTRGTSDSRSWVLYDIDLIKQDLLNHFHTRKGERVGRPTFGCSVWDLIGEQMTPDVKDEVREEVKRIVTLDTRVINRGVQVDTSDHGIVVLVDLYYRKYDIIDRFKIDFDARQ
jgi:phage baseplate assembly protein W